MKKEKSCGAVIVNDNNQVLLVKQSLGHYGFPKGHVNEGETEIETAIRETKEETNIDIAITNNKRFVISYNVKNNIKKDVVYFLAKPTSYNIVLQESEVTKAMWVDKDNVINYLEFDNIINLWQDEIIKEIK